MGLIQTTRQAILQYLTENQRATTAQLSRALQVTAADIRYHLGHLERSRMIEIVSQQAKRGLGRPVRVFALTPGGQRNNDFPLIQALLCSLPIAEKEEILRKAAQSLANAGELQEQTLTQRLVAAVKRLNTLHYQARWEAHRSSPRLIFNHCPYQLFIDEHPELCSLDSFLLTALTGQRVEQKKKLNLNAQGRSYCLFLVKADERMPDVRS